jgi:2-methylisocitrate lyase-like PEP mutase family enzyme
MNASATPSELSALASDLRALHFGERPLVLANVWDAASARAVVDAGSDAVASSSAAVAASLGEADNEGMSADTAFRAVSRISAAVQVPVTADIEGGYGLAPAEIATRLIGAGAVGCNLEDTDHHGSGVLIDADVQAERIHAVCEAGRAAGVDLVVNARVDVYIRQVVPEAERAAEAVRRGKRYVSAGATCVYPIGINDPDEIALLVREMGAPVNVWLRHDSPDIAELRRLGVARISVAAGLHRAAMARTRELASMLLADDVRWLWAT